MVLQELTYYLIEGAKIFGVQNVSEVAGHEESLLKVRVLAGIALKLMTHEHKALGGQGKQKDQDERVMKEQVRLHVQKGEGKMKLFNGEEIEAVMSCISAGYFSHYLLLQNYRCFEKRQSEEEQHIYVSAPATFTNYKDTPFVDLVVQPEVKEEPVEE